MVLHQRALPCVHPLHVMYPLLPFMMMPGLPCVHKVRKSNVKRQQRICATHHSQDVVAIETEPTHTPYGEPLFNHEDDRGDVAGDELGPDHCEEERLDDGIAARFFEACHHELEDFMAWSSLPSLRCLIFASWVVFCLSSFCCTFALKSAKSK